MTLATGPVEPEVQLIEVNSNGKPAGVKPAPTVQSLSDVITTGNPGKPTTCRVPPMRSSISNRVPVTVMPAFGPKPLMTKLSPGLLCNRRPLLV